MTFVSDDRDFSNSAIVLSVLRSPAFENGIAFLKVSGFFVVWPVFSSILYAPLPCPLAYISTRYFMGCVFNYPCNVTKKLRTRCLTSKRYCCYFGSVVLSLLVNWSITNVIIYSRPKARDAWAEFNTRLASHANITKVGRCHFAKRILRSILTLRCLQICCMASLSCNVLKRRSFFGARNAHPFSQVMFILTPYLMIIYLHSYGQTGSGKTYTMEGIERMVAEDLFRTLDNNAFDGDGCSIEDTTVSVAIFEIYGDRVQDLLNDRQRLKVLEDGRGEAVVVGLEEFRADDPSVFLALIERGQRNRTTHATEVNLHVCCNVQISSAQSTQLTVRGFYHLWVHL